MPALVLVGDAYIADVIAYAGAIEATLPIAFLEVWKDCGHMIRLERPEDLAVRLGKFSAMAAVRFIGKPIFIRTTETELEFGGNTAANARDLIIYNAGGGTIRCVRL